MNKRALSVTLKPDNLVWLQAYARAHKARSLSDALDRVLERSREKEASSAEPATVVGLISIDPEDSDLLGADEAVRALFQSAPARGAARVGREGPTRVQSGAARPRRRPRG